MGQRMSDQVTKEWVKSVILKSNRGYVRNGSDIRICSLKAVRALPKGENYMTVPLKVTVVYETEDYEEKRLDLFAKVAPTGAEHRTLGESVGAFVREALVYDELLPAMKRNSDEIGAPKSCYPDAPIKVYVNGSAGDEDPVIVMEDLGRLGYCMADRFTGASEMETCMILQSFAKFHANGIALALKMGDSFKSGNNPFKDLHSDPFDNEFIKGAFTDNTVFLTMQQALAEVSGQEGNAARLKAYLESLPGTGFNRYAEVAKVRGHPKLVGYRLGDCWLNNMMFRYEDTDEGTTKPGAIRLLDYQIVQAGAPFPDLHYFFGSSVTNEVLSRRKQLLEKEYYPELFRILELLKAPFTSAEYPFEKFWEEFLANSEFCLLSATFVLPIAMAKKEQVPDYDTGDLKVEDFKAMAKDVVDSEESGKLMKRFAHVVQVMIDSHVI